MNTPNSGHNLLSSDDESRPIFKWQPGEERIHAPRLTRRVDAVTEPTIGAISWSNDLVVDHQPNQAEKSSQHVVSDNKGSFEIIRPRHVALGDPRNDRRTVATKMLHKTKESFQTKHKNEKRRTTWSSDAVKEFEKQLSETFPTKQQRGHVLVKCTRKQFDVLEAEGGQLLLPQVYGYFGDTTPSYVMAKKQESLKHFFESCDPITLEGELNRLRNDLENLRATNKFHSTRMLEDFEDTLQFFERKLQMTQEGMALSQKFLKCYDPIRILQEQWKHISTGSRRRNKSEAKETSTTSTKAPPKQRAPRKEKSDPLFALSVHTSLTSTVSLKLTKDKRNIDPPESTRIPSVVSIPAVGARSPPSRGRSTTSMLQQNDDVASSSTRETSNDESLLAISTHAHIDIRSECTPALRNKASSFSIPLMVEIRQKRPTSEEKEPVQSERKRSRQPDDILPIPNTWIESRIEESNPIEKLRIKSQARKHSALPSVPHLNQETRCLCDPEVQDPSKGDSVVEFKAQKITNTPRGGKSPREQTHYLTRHVSRTLGAYCGRRMRSIDIVSSDDEQDASKRLCRSLVPPSRIRSSHHVSRTTLFPTQDNLPLLGLWDPEDGSDSRQGDVTGCNALTRHNAQNKFSKSSDTREGVARDDIVGAHVHLTEEQLIQEAERALEWLLTNGKPPKTGNTASNAEDIVSRVYNSSRADRDDESSSEDDDSSTSQDTDEESTLAHTLFTESNEEESRESGTLEFEQVSEDEDARLDEMPLPIPPSTICDEDATEIITWSRVSGDGNDQEECLVTPRRKTLFAFSHRRHRREQKDAFVYRPQQQQQQQQQKKKNHNHTDFAYPFERLPATPML